jgi:glutathione synthase
VRICLLISSLGDLDSSHALYANNLRTLGHSVVIGALNSIGTNNSSVTCLGGPVEQDLEWYGEFSGPLSPMDLRTFDLVWLLNQPHSGIAVDVWQILLRLNTYVPFVNDPAGLMMLNNKINLPLIVPEANLPPTIVSNDFDSVWTAYSQDSQKRWVTKPPNAGAGSDVFVLEPGSTNNRALLQSATGNASGNGAIMRGSTEGLMNKYAVLQGFVPHSAEKRIVIAGGTPMTAQIKQIASGEHRGNILQEAEFDVSEISAEESTLCTLIGERLMKYGIRFAGLDVAYPMIFEVNLVNPGGLVEPIKLGLSDTSPEVLEHILASVPS